MGDPELSSRPSTGPRSTSRSRPGSRSRPEGNMSGRSSRRGSTPRLRCSTRYRTASSPAGRRTGTSRVERRLGVAPDAALRLRAQVLARPAGAPAGVGRAEEVAALEVGPARLTDPPASAKRPSSSCTGERNHAADSCGSEDLEHLATRRGRRQSPREFVHLPVTHDSLLARVLPRRWLGEVLQI